MTESNYPAWVDAWLSSEPTLDETEIAFIRQCSLANPKSAVDFPWGCVVRCPDSSHQLGGSFLVVVGYCLVGDENLPHLVVTNPGIADRCAIVDADLVEVVGFRSFLVPDLIRQIGRAIGEA